MNRLEKKCFVASAGTHALLLTFLFTAPLIWVKKSPPLSLSELTFVPSRLVDGISSGGGNPNVTAPPAPAPARSAPQIVVAPAPPILQAPPARQQERPVQEEAEPRPKSRTRNRETATVSKKSPSRTDEQENDDPTEVTIGKHRIHVSLDRAKGGSSTSSADARAEGQANARAAAQARYAERVNSVLGAIGQNISTGTSIEVPGPGGEAYGNYAEFVIAAYKSAWAPPPDVVKGSEVVKARVVILRNGTVESFEIISRSGRPGLDDSVLRLKRLKSIAPFPEGAPDDKRAFVIRFNPIPEQE